MSNKKYSEVKVGIFVFFAALIVLSTIFWAKGVLIGKTQRDLYAYFQTINGINIGDPVTVNGVKKGKILDIDLEGDSVKVKFSVDRDIKIKKDYKVEISVLELMGGKQLFINPGKSDEEINYEMPLSGVSAADVTKIMKDVSGMTDNVKELLNKFDKAADNLNAVLINVNDIVGDKNVRYDLKSTLSNIEITSRNLNALVSENKTTLRQLTNKIGGTVDNINGLVVDTRPDLKNTFNDFSILTSRVDTLVGNLNIVISDIQQQKSGLGKFIYEDKFFDNLNKTLQELQSLSKKIRKDGLKINIF